MKLKKYLEKTDEYGNRKWLYRTFAKALGISGVTMSKILVEGYNPRCDLINKIEILTKKEVTYNDWAQGILEKKSKDLEIK